jgi:hypothetical protein
MRIEMLQSIRGVADVTGNAIQLYASGHVYNMAEPWQADLARVFLREGWAVDLDRKALDGAPENKALHTVKRPRGRPRKQVVMGG